ncbi:MAG: Gfo/Idh/MocA family protein [Acidobacteriota bacterium]
MNRRDFFRTAAGAAAPLVIPSSVFGVNDRIRVGFIGLGGRARWLIGNYDLPEYEIAAVADCFLPRCAEAAKLRAGGDKWARYQDYRRMFDKEKLDAVFVETTTHARVLIAMHALEAGLDVYAEKPVCLTVAEGRALVRAVRKHNRVLQAGTQQRSMPMDIFASKLIREGGLGRVHSVIACNFEPPLRWKPQPEQPVPDGLDWDLWCNQAELRPYHRDLQFKWGNWRDYDGGGQSWGVSGWGTHALDQVQAALGTDGTGPVEVWPEEPGPQARVTMRYASGTLLKLEQPVINDHQQLGAIFAGEKGRIQILRGNAIADDPALLEGAPDPTPEGKGEDAAHLRNFFECMRTRKKPNADVETAHRATTLCHLANICRELGRKLKWDPEAERFPGDEEANALLSRPRRKGYELPKA